VSKRADQSVALSLVGDDDDLQGSEHEGRSNVIGAGGVSRRSSGEQVADALRRAIFSGEYGPGEKIAQERVARELGVSRIPVREALVILEREGRIRLEHYRGAFVLPMDEESVRDNAELFATVLAFIGRRAAERVSPKLLGDLSRIAVEMRAAQSSRQIYRLSEKYLDTIIAAGTAPRLAHTLGRMRALAVDNLFDVVPEAAEVTRVGILDLIEAIRDGDPDRVAHRQMEMQRVSADLVISAFRERGMVPSADAP
jgi:DNA-binding GntR family transcriptional regulator